MESFLHLSRRHLSISRGIRGAVNASKPVGQKGSYSGNPGNDMADLRVGKKNLMVLTSIPAYTVSVEWTKAFSHISIN
jgi:hypothetical protein